MELTGLLANIHGFEQKLRNNYFEVIVDHKVIHYMVKSKHQPTTTRLGNLLLKLMEYTFDLKYLEGSKLKVSDTLSHLYIEEKHKISDVIPLNFLLHYSDRQILNNYHKAAGVDHLAHKSKQLLKTRTRYARKAHNQPINRYQAGNPKPIDKTEQKLTQTTLAVDKTEPPNEPSSHHLDQLKDLVSTPTANKLQLVTQSVDPLSLHQDQLQK